MVGVLILVRLKLTLLRRSMTGSRGAWMVAGAVVGAGLAVSTIVLTALYRASPAILGDLVPVQLQRVDGHRTHEVLRPLAQGSR